MLQQDKVFKAIIVYSRGNLLDGKKGRLNNNIRAIMRKCPCVKFKSFQGIS